jgi:hypothetical protein
VVILVGFVAALAAVALLLAWFVGREEQAIGRRRGWSPARRVAATTAAFVVCAVAVFYSVVGVLVVTLR